MKLLHSIKINILSYFLILLSFTLNAKEVTKENVRIVAQNFISSHFVGLTIDSITNLKSSNEHLIGYVVILKPTGYIVISSDTDISPIILYSEKGKFDFEDSDNNILLHLSSWDLEVRNKNIQINKSKRVIQDKNPNLEWDKYLFNSGETKSGQGVQAIYGPLLPEPTWSQIGFYNDFCPLDPSIPTSFGVRSVVGCVATAAAQIINYWKFPKRMYFDITHDSYTSNMGDNTKLRIPDDASIYDFPSFSELNNNLSNIQYNGSESEKAYLSFGVGIKLKMNYSSGASGAQPSAKVYRDLGFGSANYSLWSFCYEDVVNSIKNARPVQVNILNTINLLDPDIEGHSVVFDGFDTSDNSFHVNFGWSGTSDGWYIPPDLDDYSIVFSAVFDISPYPGWSQWGADERNSKRTVYSIPNQNIEKWNVSSSNYSCKGLIVGKSSDIVVSCGPQLLNSNQHPSIMIVEQDGVKKSETFIESENSNISYPVQNSIGEIFVATGSGNIYEINGITGSYSSIFHDPASDEFDDQLKIDKEDYIYANTVNKLYCINSITGTKRWEFSAPTNCYFYRGAPAIDFSGNKVFIAYYNSVSKSSSLITLHRINGTILNTKLFQDIPYSSRMVGIASIAQDGKVYFGCKTKLYVLDPSNSYSLSELYDNGFGLISDAPAIGRNGTVYFYCWKNENEAVVNALNPANGTLNWQRSFDLSELGNYGTINNIYVDNNDNLCITIHYDNGDDYYILNTYKDYGTNASLLWKRDIGKWGGFVAFGPDKTLYYSNASQITAISALREGELFPVFTNNNRPNVPVYSYPSDEDIAIDTPLTFSWSCNDPDGHPLTYDLYLGFPSGVLEVYKSNIVSSSVSVDGLIPDSTYLWAIEASDGQSSERGPVWSFTTSAVPAITVTAPNGGETWQVSSNHNITWTSTGTSGNVRIEYSINNGSSWSDIAPTTPDDGSHPWTIPNAVSTTCLVRITDIDGSPTDQSNAVFTIFNINNPPNTPRLLTPGNNTSWTTPFDISWECTDPDEGDVLNYTLRVRFKGASSWDMLSMGSLTSFPVADWDVSDLGTHEWGVIASDGELQSVSDIWEFTLANSTLTVNSPNGGETWQVGSDHNITWTSSGTSGNVRIEYSSDNGFNWTNVIANTPDDGTHPWTIPNTPSTSCLVRITDTDGSPTDQSNSIFTISEVNNPPNAPRLLTPENNTSWTTPFNISWECTDPDQGDILSYTLRVRLKGSSTWEILSMGSQTSYPVTGWSVSELGTYEWSIVASDGELQSISEIWEFTLANSTITVTSPNGGETWQIGSNQNITWTSYGTSGNVRIEYSTNYGSSWTDIISSTQDDGSHPWTIPDTPSTNCLVRISDTNGSPTDQSNALFTVAAIPVTGISVHPTTMNLYTGGATGAIFATVVPGNATNMNVTWTSSDDGVATVNSLGVVTPVASGTANITAITVEGGFSAICVVTITEHSVAVTGISVQPTTMNLNAGGATGTIFATIVPADATNQNVIWSSSAPEVATVSSTGVVSPLAAGTANIIATTVDGGFAATCAVNVAALINVTSPNGGETWRVNSNQNVTWTSNGTSGNVRIEYSTNNGSNWTDIIASTQDDGSHQWAIPDTPSTNCLVRISDTDGSPNDQSNAVFAITEISLISDLAVSDFQFLPQTFSVGAMPTLVSFRLTNFGPADLAPPNTYVNESIILSENMVIGDDDDIDIISYSDDYFLSSGNYTDIIPSHLYQYMIIPQVPTGDYYIFFGVQHSNPSALIDPDLSNNHAVRSGTIHIINESQLPSIIITSPNGGENWQAGSTQNIAWTANGTSGNVSIQYSTNNGSNWVDIIASTPDDGSHSWTIPNTPSNNCLVRITDADGNPTDQSNAVFTISAVPAIVVTSPNGGETWQIGNIQNITWISNGTSGNVRIEYSTNNGSSWSDIASTTPDDGSHLWTMPNTVSTSCLVRISDTDGSPIDQSNAVFTISPIQDITVTSPNGGETWQVSSEHSITWISNSTSGNVRIEYSTNNGSSWTEIIGSTPDDGSYSWTIPNTVSTSCLVRISDTDGSPTDQSKAVFTIGCLIPGTPIIGPITQPTCNNTTGSVIINGLPSTGSWTLSQNPEGITNSGTGSSITITGLVPGIYSYTITNSDGCTSANSDNVIILVPDKGVVPKITTKYNDLLICYNLGDSIVSYQWYKGPEAISDATKQYYQTRMVPGVYKVVTIDINGCMNPSNEINIAGTKSISVYPNPASNSFVLKIKNFSEGDATIMLLSTTGLKVMEFDVENLNEDFEIEIPISKIKEGTYIVQVMMKNNEVYYSKVVILK